MSKRNAVAYVKPKDPSFLAKLKQEIGYKDLQPTIETKVHIHAHQRITLNFLSLHLFRFLKTVLDVVESERAR